MKNVILMGIKHCGKTTQGKLLAQKCGVDFFDSDDVIFEMTGKTAREIYVQEGKDSFLNAEFLACQKISESKGNFVVATGGGICCNENAVNALRKSGVFVFLSTDEDTACDRIIKEIEIDEKGNLKNLPAYIARENPISIDNVRKIFSRFFEERTAIYRKICDVEIKMRSAPKNENLLRIYSALSDLNFLN